MKKTAILIVFALVVAVMTGPVLAGDTEHKHKTHDMAAWFVSGDAKAKMITIKDEKGDEKTVPVMGAAIKEMGTLKAGQKVWLTCQDTENGEHEGVSGIKTEMAKK